MENPEMMYYMDFFPDICKKRANVDGMDHILNKNVTDDLCPINFHPAFDNTPALLAGMHTRSGVIPASAPQTAIFGDTPDADYPGTIQDTFINISNEVNKNSEQFNTCTWQEKTPTAVPALIITYFFETNENMNQ